MANGKEKVRLNGGMWLAIVLGIAAVAAYIMGRNQDPTGTLWLLAGAGLVALGAAMYLTFRIGRTQTREDNEVDPAVKRQPFLRNPVILAYFFYGLALAIIFVWFALTF